jgi:hypothetical protein
MIAFVGSSMANSIADKDDVISESKEVVVMDSKEVEISTVEVEALYGKPSDCVRLARNAVLQAAVEYNLDISSGGNDFDVMMEMYHIIYLDCYNN